MLFSSRLQHPFHAPKSVHRLDGLVSGTLLLGTSVPGTRQLAKQFRRRSIAKRYVAILSQLPGQFSVLEKQDEGLVETEGRSTAWQVHTRMMINTTPVYVVRFEPREGKNHQLRLHAAHELNAPIMFDRRYPLAPDGLKPLSMTQPRADLVKQAPQDGIALHCASMTFRFGLQETHVACEPPSLGIWQHFSKMYGINWTQVAHMDSI
ncbi:pseudouridine synthase [Protomyces lactucae-debilis]|uniref:Pseudouridine synthase n=1 Tax=Protomyces lactucae-debilis TaxID=2754530 RepID=A0A1Y2FIZ4_PROLT|nr:pseudouridine synthase [Protomyces lactucae-debilis]ORY83903.1 pseudouridine synthase [Protomyces lactucae-debilis]